VLTEECVIDPISPSVLTDHTTKSHWPVVITASPHFGGLRFELKIFIIVSSVILGEC